MLRERQSTIESPTEYETGQAMEELCEKMDKTRNNEHLLSEIIKITNLTKYNTEK